MGTSTRDGWPLGLHFQEFGSQLLLLHSPLPLSFLLHLACPGPVQEERSPKSWSHGLDGPSARAGVVMHQGKPLQEWWDWDGFGPYKYRHHHYPRNITLRDVQRRRIFKQHHRERGLVRSVYMNDLLPKELQEKAREKVVWEIPLDADKIRPNFRCVVSGRSRGVYRDFRVSRFIFRQEADYNRVSGVQRAHWTHNTKIQP